jgi:hypothetical protein
MQPSNGTHLMTNLMQPFNGIRLITGDSEFYNLARDYSITSNDFTLLITHPNRLAEYIPKILEKPATPAEDKLIRICQIASQMKCYVVIIHFILNAIEDEIW